MVLCTWCCQLIRESNWYENARSNLWMIREVLDLFSNFPFLRRSLITDAFWYLSWCLLWTKGLMCVFTFLHQSISSEQSKRFTKFRERKGLIEKDVVCQVAQFFLDLRINFFHELKKVVCFLTVNCVFVYFQGKDR